MKFSLSIFLALAASAAAFAPNIQQRAFAPRSTTLRMSDEDDAPAAPAPAAAAPASPASSSGGKLVPVKEETVEFTAGILGAAAGLFLAGPVGAFIVGAASNYASKGDNEVSEVVNAASKSSIQVYNYLTTLDGKYDILAKAKASLENALDKLKSKGDVDPAAIDKVENALSSTNAKIKEINDEYDLVGGATTALGIVGDLVEKAVQKAGELNEEYNLSEKAKTALSGAVDKAKDAAKKA